MLFRSLLFLLLVQTCFSQERINVLLDSLTLVSDNESSARISQEIAWELKDSDWERTLHYIEYSEEFAKTSNSKKIKADHFNAIANIYYSKDALDVALDYYLKSYNYYKESNDETKKYILENDLAIIYARLNNKEKALFYFNNIADHWAKNKDSLSLAKVYNNMGTLYLERDLDSSLYYYQKTLSIAEKLKNNELNTFVYTNLGRVYLGKENSKLADKNFTKAINLVEKNHADESDAWVYNSVAEYYLIEKNTDSAVLYANKSLELLKNDSYSFSKLKAVEHLYKSYLLGRDFEKASTYFERFNEIRDSLNIEEKAVNVEKLKLAQEYKTKEQIRTLEESKQQFKYLIIGLSLVSVLLVLALLLIRSRNRLVNARLEKDLVEAKQKELNSHLELKNKELIAKAMMEIHRTEIIEEILKDLKHIKLKAVKKETQQAIDYILKRLIRDTNSNIWNEFETRFEQVYESFYKALNKKHPELTSRDKKLCALLKLNLTSKEIAQLTGQTFKSVENARTRLRKKLNLTNTKTDLATYLYELG